MDKPTREGGEAAIAWLKKSGQRPDLSVFWRNSSAPGSAERHLKLLNMLFQPTDSGGSDILPPNG